MTPSVPLLILVAMSPLSLAPATRLSSGGEWSDGKSVPLATSDWEEIRTAHERASHRFFRQSDGTYAARNPGQQWRSEFDGAGMMVRPDHGEWTWGLELAGFGRASLRDEGDRVAGERDGHLTEWFRNDRRGLEQGWTLHHPPPDGDALRLQLVVRGGLEPVVDEDGDGVAFRDQEGEEAVTYRQLKAWDADGIALAACFEAGGRDRFFLSVDTEGARYPVTIDPVVQQAYLKASNTGSSDGFGSSVALAGNTAVVGAPLESSNATGVNGNAFDESAMHAGAAYVFVRSGDTWTQQAYLKAANTGAGDGFGWSVAVHGDTVVVGAYQEDSNAIGVGGSGANNAATDAGAAYVFVRNGGTWSQQAYLKASNTGAGDLFGAAVAIEGNTVVVGANRESSQATGIGGDASNNAAPAAGAAYVFTRSGTTWSQQAYVKASDTSPGSEFGGCLALSGETLVVGAPLADDNAGSVYAFVRSGVSWSQQARLVASNTAALSFFGQALDLSGDTLVAGAPGEASAATGVGGNQADVSAPNAGAAYVFTRGGSVWTQQAYLKASNAATGDSFGKAVAIDGHAVVVGAPGEDSAAGGLDGDQANNSASSAGAGYVFGRVGTTWSQFSYLKASNPEAGDEFGRSVAVSPGTALVGALRESSNALGVNGTQGNNLAPWSGAAYSFALPVLGVPEIEVWDGAVALQSGGPGVAYGAVATGTGLARTLRVRNGGTEPLSLSGAVISGVDASRFSLAPGSVPTVLAGGQEVTLTVTFSAPSAGVYQAALQLASDDNDESAFMIELSASAAAAADLYSEWAMAQGLVGPAAGPDAEPFGEGVENLLKYAFNLAGDRADVRSLVPGSGTAGLPVFRLVGSGANAVLRAEFLRRRGSGLNYVPKVSTTLGAGSFAPMTGTTTVTVIDAAWERVVMDEPRNPGTYPQAFGVVEVSLP